MTVIRAVWLAYIGPDVLVLQVIWVIGASMVVLAGLVWLPRAAIAAFAVALIAGHNLLDGVHADQLGSLRWLWLLLHEEGTARAVPRRALARHLPAGPVGGGDGGRLRDRALGRCCRARSGARRSCAPAWR